MMVEGEDELQEIPPPFPLVVFLEIVLFVSVRWEKEHNTPPP